MKPGRRPIRRARALAVGALLAGAGGAALLFAAYRGWLPGGGPLRELLHGARDRGRVADFARKAPEIPAGSVVFLGSSTISAFPLARLYPGAPAVNRGLGGETTAGLLARLDASLPVAPPAGLILYAGANDMRVRAGAVGPAETAARVRRVLDVLSARFPAAPVALIELMPERDEPPEALVRLRALNESLRALAAERGAAFVRTSRPPLVTPEGRLSPTMTDDGVHLHAAGYTVLARWILEDAGPAAAPLRR